MINTRSTRPAFYAGLLLLGLALVLVACDTPFGGEAGTAPQDSALGCESTRDDRLVRAVVERFDADYDQVVRWICDGESLDDVMLALQTSRLTGRPVAEVLELSKEVGWQALWQGYDIPQAAIAGTEEPTSAPATGEASQPDGTLSRETGADNSALVTRSGQHVGSAAITWDGDRFVLVGRIVEYEPQNRALQVRVPTEGSREATYLVRLPDNELASEPWTGRWVRIQGERGTGAYLLAHEIELLYESRAGVTATPEHPPAFASPVPIQEGGASEGTDDGDSKDGVGKGKNEDKAKGKDEGKGTGKGKGKGKD